jgi:predicted nucleotidyltransferase
VKEAPDLAPTKTQPFDAADYLELLDELRLILEAPVDLVMEGAVKNRFIAADIERTKQVLYAA